MDERLRKRRSRVRWEQGRGRRTVVFLVMFSLCVVGTFLWARSTEIFAVKRIAAVGVESIGQTQIAAVTAGVMGKNLLVVSTAELERALRALPYVESAEVHRAFPNTLEIEITEYRPAARLQDDDGQVWVVSDSGQVLKGAQAAHFPDLPLLVPDAALAVRAGETLPSVLADVLPLAVLLENEGIRARMPDIAGIVVSEGGFASLLLVGGGELRLGTPEGLERKLGAALDVIQQCIAQGRLFEYVDASVAGRVAVKAK